MVSSGNPKPQSTSRIWSLYSYTYILRVTSSTPPRDKNLTVSSCISSVFCVCAFVMKKPFWRPLRIQARKDVEKACSEWHWRFCSAWEKLRSPVLPSRHSPLLNCPQDAQRRLLRLGETPDARDSEALVGPVATQGA